MKRTFILLLVLQGLIVVAYSQHEHHQPQKKAPAKTTQKKTTTKRITKKKPVTQSRTTPVKQEKDSANMKAHLAHQDTIPVSHHEHIKKDSDNVKTDHQHTDTLPPSHHQHRKKDTVPTVHSAHTQNEMTGMESMSHAFSMNLPMNRNGSGTGWLPDASPMYGYMFHSKKWMYMIHGNVFLRYNKQDISNKGVRGDEEWDVPNWFMAMGQTRIGTKGLVHISSMFSLDRLIAGGDGYPLLFQSGETWKGQPLVDRQHPHDLFSELSMSYSHAFSKKVDAFIYVGYPGEPALGSVAFMHRPSALNNPDAPISHHWNDGTHITFGVATIGIRVDKFKMEASSFTGREPDENRYNFDKPRFDSWSGRLSFNPSANSALQISHGFVKSPEVAHPDEDIKRTTASVIFSWPMKEDNLLNATILWGLNKTKGHEGENAILTEASWTMKKFSPYFRYEWIQKSTEELTLDEGLYGEHTLFPVNAFTAGLNYDIFSFGQTRFALGGHLTFFHADKRLDNLYGKNPIGAEVFLRIYPGLMKMKVDHSQSHH